MMRALMDFRPCPPSLASPTNCEVVSNPPTLTWNSALLSSGPINYRLQISTTINFTSTVLDVSGIDTGSYATSGLANTTKYYWRVMATNAVGSSSWSESRSFYTAPLAVPTLSGTSVRIGNDLFPRLSWSWNSVGCGDMYTLYRYICESPADCESEPLLGPTIVYAGTATSFTDGLALGTQPTYAFYYVTASANGGQSTSNPSNKVSYQLKYASKYGSDLANPPGTIPKETKIDDCYPNPFNPLTVIRYQLSEDLHVKITVFNTLGVEVATLVDGVMSAGYKSVEFDATSLPSGVYFYKLTAGSHSDVKKMVLAR
ncbi:MAG: T9SS type A sorting domain-containing protein [Ignavibacteriae bacterium]|nr:T9SS type A sorting domain-containing protein [Ignavibacteriota bacterium]